MQRPISTLPGAGDRAGERLQEAIALQEALLRVVGAWGYQRIETPLMEEADLFLRKSGGELAARLYSVNDPGGRRVALRPEYTASVIRAFVSQKADVSLPVRWCYAGPVLRHQPLEQGDLRQVTQVGAELVGASGLWADAEVLAIVCEGMQRAGLRRTVLTLGHLGVLADLLLAFGLSDRAEHFLLSRLGVLQGSEQGAEALLQEARLLRLMPDGSANGALNRVLADMDPEEARRAVHQIVASLSPSWVGGRDVAEVESRLLQKLSQTENPEKMRQAVHFLSDLVRIHGDGRSVVEQAEAVVRRYGLDASALDPLAGLVDVLEGLLEAQGVERVWSLGFARGLAYYTGVVFEMTHSGLPGRALGGGGRYDGLVKALGGPDLPALGFAYSLELMDEARAVENLPPLAGRQRQTRSVIVALRREDALAALAEARRLRAAQDDTAVSVYPAPGAVEKARDHARRSGAVELVIVGPEGARAERLGGRRS
jgi:histidyl-tRNA synthetase